MPISKVSLYSSIIFLGFLFLLGIGADYVASLQNFSTKSNFEQLFVKPNLDSDYILGTDQYGRDVLSIMVVGTRTSLFVGVISMFISTLLGIIIGGLTGFIGDYVLRVSLVHIILSPFYLLLLLYYGYYLPVNLEQWQHFYLSWPLLAVLVIVILILKLLIWLIKKLITKKIVYIPLDLVTQRFIEVFSSIPMFLTLVAVISLINPTLLNFTFIIGVFSWGSSAQLIRAEMIKIRTFQYVEAGYAIGQGYIRNFIYNALPNSLPTIIIFFTYGVGNIILLEATLSFLGIGLAPEEVSWGRLMAGARQNLQAWWLILFPGIILIVTQLSIHRMGRQAKMKIK